MSFATPVQICSSIALLLACSYALWRGGRPERLAAVLIFLDWEISPVLGNHDAFKHAQIGIFALDGVLALALLLISLSTNRIWPLWVAAFQILEILMHAAMLIDPHVRARAYYIGMEIWSYLMLFALALGTWREASPKAPTAAANRSDKASSAFEI
jgi:hypothetical protein